MRWNVFPIIMATLGKVDEFNTKKPQYEERLTHFFQANDIDDARKKKVAIVCYWPCDVQTALKSIGSREAW